MIFQNVKKNKVNFNGIDVEIRNLIEMILVENPIKRPSVA